MQLANYTTSKDYEYLAELMLEYSIVCIIYKDSKGFEFNPPRLAIANIKKEDSSQLIYRITNNGGYCGFIYQYSKGEFIKQCQDYDLSFIVPNE